MIQSEVLLSFVIGSDVGPSDIGSRLTPCVANHTFTSPRLFTKVLSIYISDNISGKRHALSHAPQISRRRCSLLDILNI